MKTPSVPLSFAALLLSLTTALADAPSEVSDAIKKLSDEANYSWQTTPKVEGSESARRLGPVEGKTEKDGLSYFKGSLGDNSYELAVNGQKLVVNYTGEWLTPTELGAEEQVNRLRLTLKKPAEEAATLASQVNEMKKESEGVYSGELKPGAAKGLFALLGRRAAAAPEAQGTIKFWVKSGQLAKYEYLVHGKITAGEDKKEVEIRRTVTVEIKDVGSTRISIPEGARKKIS
jgi:hypothetical protein